jgi:hypothetical protein
MRREALIFSPSLVGKGLGVRFVFTFSVSIQISKQEVFQNII